MATPKPHAARERPASHPLFLEGEDGEVIWIRDGVFADEKEAIYAFDNTHGTDWKEWHVRCGLVHMKLRPAADDPTWHDQVDKPGPFTAAYWRFER